MFNCFLHLLCFFISFRRIYCTSERNENVYIRYSKYNTFCKYIVYERIIISQLILFCFFFFRFERITNGRCQTAPNDMDNILCNKLFNLVLTLPRSSLPQPCPSLALHFLQPISPPILSQLSVILYFLVNVNR